VNVATVRSSSSWRSVAANGRHAAVSGASPTTAAPEATAALPAAEAIVTVIGKVPARAYVWRPGIRKVVPAGEVPTGTGVAASRGVPSPQLIRT
jgi:hypothetical protein